nr:MAG TPA: hypothetical protein [Caudoviricetes sp.]
MKKSEAKALQQEYHMEILRHPVTSEAWALYLETAQPIQALDDLATQELTPCAMVADYSLQEIDKITYKLVCPTSWFDLWGWTE